jgi:vacuolar-type H+-ATPase subunit H
MPSFIYLIRRLVIMSTTKEQRIKEQEVTISSQQQVQQKEQHQSVNRALDETKNNIKRATDEARKDIPRYTQAVNEYQEQTIQTTREIADNFLESQKEIINSFQSAWLPQIEAANRVFTSNWMVSPRHLADNYARIVSSFADNTIAATRLANNTIFANLEAFKTSVQTARDNVKEFSRIGVNAARTLEQTSRDTTTRFS